MFQRHLSALVVVIALAGASAAPAAIESTFDADLDGWTKINDVTIAHVATGGNPGGYAQFDDFATGQLFAARAPAKFLGDLSAANGQTLSFDAIVLFQQRNDPLAGFGVVKISSSTDSASLDLGAIPAATWTGYAAPLDAAAWGKTEADWYALLADVTEIRVELEAIDGDETVGFDNFRIVPEPASAAMIGGAGLALLARRRR